MLRYEKSNDAGSQMQIRTDAKNSFLLFSFTQTSSLIKMLEIGGQRYLSAASTVKFKNQGREAVPPGPIHLFSMPGHVLFRMPETFRQTYPFTSINL